MTHKATRTWAAMLVALGLCLALTACGSGGDTPTGDNTTSGTSSTPMEMSRDTPSGNPQGNGNLSGVVLQKELGELVCTFQHGAPGSVSYGGTEITGNADDLSETPQNDYSNFVSTGGWFYDMQEGVVAFEDGVSMDGAVTISNMKMALGAMEMKQTDGQWAMGMMNFNFSGDVLVTVSTSDYGSFSQRFCRVPLWDAGNGLVIWILVDVSASGSHCVKGGGSLTVQSHIDMSVGVGEDSVPNFSQNSSISFAAPGTSIRADMSGLLIFEYMNEPVYDMGFLISGIEFGDESITEYPDDNGVMQEIEWRASYHLTKTLALSSGINTGGLYTGAGDGDFQYIWEEWPVNETFESGIYEYANHASMLTPSGSPVWGGAGPSSDGPAGP